MKHFSSLLKSLLGWPLTIAAFFFIFRIIAPHFSETIQSIKSINFLLLVLGIICFILYFFIRSIFWKKLLELKGHVLSLKEISYYWGFTEIKRYIPGNIWSLVARASMLKEKEVSTITTFTATVIEAEFITVASTILSLFSLNFIIYGLLPKFPNKGLLVFLLATVTIVLSIVFAYNRYILKILKLQYLLKIKNFKLKIFPNFSPRDNFYLLFVKTAAMFFFGLGTYFSISSLTLLYPPYIMTLIGFFVFSLLAGYLTLLTPMGLGIREGVMAYGLSKFIPVGIAGFAAIFARIIFIVSELLFLLLSYLWYASKNKYILSTEGFIKKYRYEIFLGIGIGLYILYFTAATFARYDNFFTGRFDLGNMDQTVWNTLHGRIFQVTDPNGTDIISRLAFHADFMLILLAPFYLLWQDPKMLLFIQTVVLGLGALFTFLITERIVKNKNTALLFSLLYLLNPSVAYTNLYDFHAVTFATTLLLGAFYFLKTKRYIGCIIFLFLAGLTKEEVWIITALFGIYAFFYEKKKILGTAITVCSITIFFFLVFYAIPHVRGGTHFVLSYYSDLGTSPSGIIKTLLLSPMKTVATVLGKGQLIYLFELFFPLGFLSFAAPLFLLFITPELAADLLSTNGNPHQIYYQYTATLTPFIFIAAIYGYNMLSVKRKALSVKLSVFSLRFTLHPYLLLATILAAYSYGPLPGAKSPSLDMFVREQPYRQVIDNFLTSIPKKFSVAATNNLGSHLSRRQKIFTIPNGIDKADIIVFLLNDPYAQPSLPAQKQMAENMKHDKNYIEVFKLDDFIVFEKRNLYRQTEPEVNKVKLFPLSIPALQNRDFTGGQIITEEAVLSTSTYDSSIISYPSDGLQLYARMDIPKRAAPPKGFPVLILNHGFDDRKIYNTQTSYQTIASFFAERGFLVIKPDFRGYGMSEDDSNLPRTLSYPIDVLNLLSSLPYLDEVNLQAVFFWGQSGGATVTLTTIEAHDQNHNYLYPLKGAAIWAPVTDPYLAYTRTKTASPNQRAPYTRAVQLLGTPDKNPLLWQSLSPIFYVDDIRTPIQINQGLNDPVVSYQESIALYGDLLSFNKSSSLRLYPNEDNTFSQSQRQALMDNYVFFEKLLGK